MKPPIAICKQRSNVVILVSCKKRNFLVAFWWNWNFDAQNHASNLNFVSTWMKLIKNFGFLDIEIVLDAIVSRQYFSFIKRFTVFHTFSLFSPVSFFLWNSFHTFCQFHNFFPFFFRKSTSFCHVFVKKWGFTDIFRRIKFKPWVVLWNLTKK